MQSIIVNGFTHNYQSISKGIPDINIVAICGYSGGFSGPANLYHNIMINPYDNFTFTCVDIACSFNLEEDYSYELHFNHLVDLVVEVSKLMYLKNTKSVVLIGWSMGGAVVIEAGYNLQKKITISGIITISSQLEQIRNIKKLNDDIFKLFIHGDNDSILSHEISQHLYKQVNNRKMIQIIKDGDHFLSGNEKYLYELVKNVLIHIVKIYSGKSART
jgi:pimeloyl-ACP methyl ester carboxylesterase